MSIDFNGIKDGAVSVYQTTSAFVVEWSGRTISLIKSGVEKGVPYLQYRAVAAVSVIALSLLLIELGQLFNRLLSCFISEEKLTKDVRFYIGLGILGGGVAGFARATSLALPWYVTGGLTVATAIIRGQFSRP